MATVGCHSNQGFYPIGINKKPLFIPCQQSLNVHVFAVINSHGQCHSKFQSAMNCQYLNFLIKMKMKNLINRTHTTGRSLIYSNYKIFHAFSNGSLYSTYSCNLEKNFQAIVPFLMKWNVVVSTLLTLLNTPRIVHIPKIS